MDVHALCRTTKAWALVPDARGPASTGSAHGCTDDHEPVAPPAARLASVNAAGDAAPGFRWRLQGEGGDATDVEAFGWDAAGSHGVIVNLTTWTNPRALVDFVFSPVHLAVMRRRRTWFHRVTEATTALWWVPTGHRPTTDEAEQRVRHLREHGPSAEAFT